jgi:hypothetical protein
MSECISVKEFLDACEARLARAEGVLKEPLRLQEELMGLEQLLRSNWPNAIIALKEVGMTPEHKQKIEAIFKRITKIEEHTQSTNSIFDGLEDFMQRSIKR